MQRMEEGLAEWRFCWDFLDIGVIRFRIPPEALVARDWSQVVALADSC